MEFSPTIKLKARNGANITITSFEGIDIERPIEGAWENNGVWTPINWRVGGRFNNKGDSPFDIDFESISV